LNFDFIIIGAGSAGCVLAERLSASGRHSVLVLEAGGSDRRFFIHMPLGYGKTFYDPAVNWMYQAEPDPGLAGQRDYWPRGKVLGGSSSINAMVYVRGHPRDYDDWKEAGNPGWGWDDVLPAFKAMEDFDGGANEWRGSRGPLQISSLGAARHPLTDAFMRSAAAAGLSRNDDYNGAEQEGVSLYQFTIKNGLRLSAARAFLRPALRRRYVRVETHALASRVLFEGKRAVGVEYLKGGATHVAHAAREVIVAGGAVNSVQLLQLSGIGPPQLLQDSGIEVLIGNGNAGAHLQDHVGLNYTWKAKVPTLNEVLRPWWGKLRVGVQYLLTRGGPLSLSINQAGGFLRSDTNRDRPNIQLYMQPFSTLIPKEGERPLLTPDPFPGFSLGLSNCRPTSRGNIAIRSADARDAPRITANAYATEHDVREMLDAVKMLRRIAAAEPLASLIAEELRPGPSVRTDDQLTDDLRRRSGTVYHPCSTCRMGPDPAASVVDAKLKVHGVERLRVCDASIFPNIISGNINAAAMMVGWKGAELIAESS
jgi:choline dehydrogenase